MYDPSPEPQYNPLVGQYHSCMNLMKIDQGASYSIVYIFTEFEGVHKAACCTARVFVGRIIEGAEVEWTQVIVL
jgi:hypothetical protein